jgi:hypothetical protein
MQGENENRLTKVELAVQLFTVDYVESIGNTSFHVADFEVEPLMVMIGIDIWVQYQVVFIPANLQSTKRKHYQGLLHTPFSKPQGHAQTLFPIATAVNGSTAHAPGLETEKLHLAFNQQELIQQMQLWNLFTSQITPQQEKEQLSWNAKITGR